MTSDTGDRSLQPSYKQYTSLKESVGSAECAHTTRPTPKAKGGTRLRLSVQRRHQLVSTPTPGNLIILFPNLAPKHNLSFSNTFQWILLIHNKQKSTLN